LHLTVRSMASGLRLLVQVTGLNVFCDVLVHIKLVVFALGKFKRLLLTIIACN